MSAKRNVLRNKLLRPDTIVLEKPTAEKLEIKKLRVERQTKAPEETTHATATESQILTGGSASATLGRASDPERAKSFECRILGPHLKIAGGTRNHNCPQ